ncbi:YveK family protein [Desemzia incerta]|uniref:hypothetical protein n=1 Tax=Desemzia incerta TaxID=82801 RepID=UPI001660E3D1|nr:hypothetical protein [Desemzia incerta]
MKNLPTIEELISFLKDNLRIIILSIVTCLMLFIAGVGYTTFTNDKVENELQNTNEEDNLLSDIDNTIPIEEQLKPEEIEVIVDKLQEDGVEFSFYLEKESADPFQSTTLLKEILTSPSVIQIVEEETNVKIEPNPEVAVNVDLNSSNLLMTITIGTGDAEKNKALADAYFNIVSEEQHEFFDNKVVYTVSQPEPVDSNVTEGENSDNSSVVQGVNGVSYTQLIILAIGVGVFGAMLGILISIAKSLFRKEVTEIYGFAIKDDDQVINISNLKYSAKSESSKQLVHTIVHPSEKVKLILSEEKLGEEIISYLQKETRVETRTKNIQLDKYDEIIFISQSIIEVDPKVAINEIVFICKKNHTSKKWYETQRKLIETYNAAIKVILL